jgi:hypothetical protein
VIEIPFGMLIRFLPWFFLRYGFGGFYTVGPSERAVLTSFGRAARIPRQTRLNDPVSSALRADGVKQSLAHVMGYFTSILRDRIANFTAPAAPADPGADVVQTISINDLRRHLRDLNENMNVECAAAAARYGITFALRAYLRNAGLGLLRKARQLVLTRDMKEAP